MAFNLKKLDQIAVPRSEIAIEQAKTRLESREWIRMSQDIALCLHYYLRQAGLTQKDLAERMGVSATYIGKLLKGNENLTLETICKIQQVIGVKLISVLQPYAQTVAVSLSPSAPKKSANSFHDDELIESTAQVTDTLYI